MNRINKILQHFRYKEYVAKIEEYEKNRIFCKHDMGHFLDVCRLAEILYLQECLNYSKELESQKKDSSSDSENDQQGLEEKKIVDFIEQIPILGLMQDKTKKQRKFTEWIYAAGLLHDIGRWQEYETGIRHETASANLAPEILLDCDFTKEESKEILLAISNHRNKNVKHEKSLSGILYRADKMSRSCFFCKAEKECDWDLQKKNMEIMF